MKFNNGFAPDMRKMAWKRPRMLPITNADEADGMCLLLGICLNFDTSKLLICIDPDRWSLDSVHDTTVEYRLQNNCSESNSCECIFLSDFKCKSWQLGTTDALPLWGINSLFSAFSIEPASKYLLSCTSELTLPIASSSATKDVVTLTSGNIAIRDTWLNSAIDTPTAASSTGPVETKKSEQHQILQNRPICTNPHLN